MAQVPRTLVFWQDDFPFYEASPVQRPMLEAALAHSEFAGEDQLGAALSAGNVALLVLPYGSAFPLAAWPQILSYLERGGNLLTIGGAPFSVPVQRQRQSFVPGRPTVAYQKALLINQAWPIPAQDLLLRTAHPSLSSVGGGWRVRRAWSLMARLSDEDYYARTGSQGVACAQIEPLVEAVSADGRTLAVPVVMLDHYHNRFAGGRWVMLNFEAEDGFNASEEAIQLLSSCQRLALRGAIQFDVRPAFATVAPGEAAGLVIHCRAWQEFTGAMLTYRLEGPGVESAGQYNHPLDIGHTPQHIHLALPASSEPGLRTVHLRLRSDSGLLAEAESGFWVRDEALLRGSESLRASGEWFARQGQPLPIVGTTYMAGRVHRQFLWQPNPAIWERDFAAMQAAGINFVRTGVWTGYEQIMLEPGIVREDILRALEAFLHSAARHSIAVQFCLFAFQPDAFGKGNPYLDPEMRARQEEYVSAFVRRFKDVPCLSWDLINEPSQFDPQALFRQRPNYDIHEFRAWNTWLRGRYGSYEQILAAWNMTPEQAGAPGQLRLPRLSELSYRQRWQGDKPLIANDWHLFCQWAFADWVAQMVRTIRAGGSEQMITVGQDEGAVDGRPSPWFHGQLLDHSCIHTWWLNDALLWDELCAAIPGKPLLVQETGIMQYEQLDECSRRDEENRARLLERKFVLALAAGAGYVQWLWNTNTHMNDDNEVAIGALRADGSEKPEMRCTRLTAPFAQVLARYAGPSRAARAVVVQTQSVLYSVLQPLSLQATQAAVRALAYDLSTPCRVVGENAIAAEHDADLIVLPYPRALSEAAWQGLLDAVRRGGTLLISGPVGDGHFHASSWLGKLGLAGSIAPITARSAWQDGLASRFALTYSGEALNVVDRWAFEGGGTLRQVQLGSGRIVMCSYPLELNDNHDAIPALYREVIEWEAKRLGHPLSEFAAVKQPGVLIWQRRFERATLYAFVSEAAAAGEVQLTDRESGARVSVWLDSERASMLLLGRPDGTPLAAYLHGRLAVNDVELWAGSDAALSWVNGQAQVTQLH